MTKAAATRGSGVLPPRRCVACVIPGLSGMLVDGQFRAIRTLVELDEVLPYFQTPRG